MLKFIKKWFWIIQDRCEFCGGEFDIWDYKKALIN